MAVSGGLDESVTVRRNVLVPGDPIEPERVSPEKLKPDGSVEAERV